MPRSTSQSPTASVQTVGPVNFRARPEGRLLWQFDLAIPETVGVRGQVVSGRDWAHEVGFSVADVEPLVHRLAGSDLSPIRAAGRWEGKVVQDSLERDHPARFAGHRTAGGSRRHRRAGEIRRDRG